MKDVVLLSDARDQACDREQEREAKNGEER